VITVDPLARLIERIAVLIAFVGIAVGLVSGSAVLGGSMFWGSLLVGWLISRYVQEYMDDKRDESEG
jgi:hypothetical protein